MTLFTKWVVSVLVAMLLFEAMAKAFHLLNLPSDRAVLAGTCLLLGIFVGGYAVLRAVWRRI